MSNSPTVTVTLPVKMLQNLLTLREGRRDVVYRDIKGALTAGIGHRLTPRDLETYRLGDQVPPSAVEQWFTMDTAAALISAYKQATAARIAEPEFIPYLASVNFQLGSNWTLAFPVCWAFIMGRNYIGAASDLDTTAWKRETPIRVADFQGALRMLHARSSS